MPKGNLNNQTKRTRELAKKDKRAAKDAKRAVRKAEARVARGVVDGTPAPVATPVAKASVTSLAAAAFIRRMHKTP